MSVYFCVLLYFLINWLGMLDNGVFFDLEAIVRQILIILASEMAQKWAKLAKIEVCLENAEKGETEIQFFCPVFT